MTSFLFSKCNMTGIYGVRVFEMIYRMNAVKNGAACRIASQVVKLKYIYFSIYLFSGHGIA